MLKWGEIDCEHPQVQVERNETGHYILLALKSGQIHANFQLLLDKFLHGVTI